MKTQVQTDEDPGDQSPYFYVDILYDRLPSNS